MRVVALQSGAGDRADPALSEAARLRRPRSDRRGRIVRVGDDVARVRRRVVARRVVPDARRAAGVGEADEVVALEHGAVGRVDDVAVAVRAVGVDAHVPGEPRAAVAGEDHEPRAAAAVGAGVAAGARDRARLGDGRRRARHGGVGERRAADAQQPPVGGDRGAQAGADDREAAVGLGPAQHADAGGRRRGGRRRQRGQLGVTEAEEALVALTQSSAIRAGAAPLRPVSAPSVRPTWRGVPVAGSSATTACGPSWRVSARAPDPAAEGSFCGSAERTSYGACPVCLCALPAAAAPAARTAPGTSAAAVAASSGATGAGRRGRRRRMGFTCGCSSDGWGRTRSTRDRHDDAALERFQQISSGKRPLARQRSFASWRPSEG